MTGPGRITLMRHGKPLLAAGPWLAPCQMAGWIAEYDRAVVDHAGRIPPTSRTAARSASVIMTSDLARAISSVRVLGRCAVVADALFAEAALPFAAWPCPRLPAPVWAAFFRLLWLCGYSRGGASMQVEKARAQAAATMLVLAAREGSVLLVGHGVMNRLIARELTASGWTAQGAHGNRYWCTGVYHAPADPTAFR